MSTDDSESRSRRAIRPLHRGRVALAVLSIGLILAGLAGIPGGQKPQQGTQKASKLGRAPATQRRLRLRVERSMFVWDASVAADQAAREAVVGFAYEQGIDQLFVDASPVGYGLAGAEADFRALVDEAHASGILVVAAGGFPWWGVSDTAGLANQPTGHNEGWAYYSSIATSSVPFDGILDDTEPYLADPDDWNARTRERAQDYLDFLRGVRSRTGSMQLFATIPFWYDEDPRYDLALDGQAESAPVNHYIAGIADAVVVMAYRDLARGPDGILEHAAGELAAGPTLIAVETMSLGADPISDKLSFWEEGRAVLERELALITRDLRREPNLMGFAIHDEAAYRLLAP